MLFIREPYALSGALYEWAEDDVGPVQVADKHGRQGWFDRDGLWVLGDLRVADPESHRRHDIPGPALREGQVMRHDIHPGGVRHNVGPDIAGRRQRHREIGAA